MSTHDKSRPDVIPVLSIADLQEASGFPRTTIHCYLRLGLLPRPQKTAASRSLYTEEHLSILERIRELKGAGLSLAQIREELRPRIARAGEPTVDLVAQESQRMHDRILAVAAQEFATKGYKNTHVRTIVQTLGITSNLFYSHFPSKRALLVECVARIHEWGVRWADDKRVLIDDPVERFLWLAIAHSRVFGFGQDAMAELLVHTHDDQEGEVSARMEAAWAGTIDRIMRELTAPGSQRLSAKVPDDLIASSLFGALDYTMRSRAGRYSHRDILRAHLWLFLAARAARNGDVDIDAELERYEAMLGLFGEVLPPLPPGMEEDRQ